MRLAIASSLCLLVASTAFAQDSKRAEDLFEKGRRAMNAGNYALACPMLEESQRLDPGGGTLLNLALCHEKAGKLALAKREYEESLVRARADRRKDREKVAAESIARLVARIPRVGLLVHETAADLVVRVDGADVPRPEWSSVALDPGTHAIEASASGHITWQASIVLNEGQVTTIDIPPLTVIAPDPSPLPPPPSPLPPPPPPDVHVGAPVPIVGPPEKKHWLFWPMVATSGAMLGTSAVTGILALVEKGNADSSCNASRGYCINSKGLESIDRARTYAWISTITLGVGVAAAAVALFLPNQKAGVGVIAGPNLVGLSWQAPLP